MQYSVEDNDGMSKNKTITVEVHNGEKPVINVNNKILKVGDTFNPLASVTANDKEDGDLTKKIKITSNNVDTKVAGNYKVVYEVTDSDGNKAVKSVAVKVEKLIVGWNKENGKWYYCNNTGKYVKNISLKIKGKTYKFDKNGVCLNP